ncbi:MAG: DUF2282 domain-containing protein [Rickettsiales bacterium]|nr:DUF2282 domain-containing protein [Rickettsiales bacterium]
MNKSWIAATALTALLTAHTAQADEKSAAPEREKCYGVVKAGKNDCSSKDGKHGCAASAKENASPNEWVYTPKGLCDKLVGGVKG